MLTRELKQADATRFNTTQVYYIKSNKRNIAVDRVKYVGCTKESHVEYDQDGEQYWTEEIVLLFVSIDLPDTVYKCFRTKDLPVENLQKLFAFDIVKELLKNPNDSE